jgi:hypothetical protein
VKCQQNLDKLTLPIFIIGFLIVSPGSLVVNAFRVRQYYYGKLEYLEADKFGKVKMEAFFSHAPGVKFI